MNRAGPIVVLMICLGSAGCTSGQWTRWEPDSYTVRKGDTVYGIAWRYGIDYRELARWNHLDREYGIYPGQVLVLHPPAGSGSAVVRPSAPSATTARTAKPAPRPATRDPSPSWAWPAPGPVIAAFGSSSSGKGVDIGGGNKSDVYAAADGSVVYSGSGLIGYGQLIIVKHNNTFLSAYGHNSELLVSQGDKVGKGQRIARMGEGPGKRPMLHFEIRIDGKPVDPLIYLPARSR